MAECVKETVEEGLVTSDVLFSCPEEFRGDERLGAKDGETAFPVGPHVVQSRRRDNIRDLSQAQRQEG